MGVPLRQDAILDYWQSVDKGLYDEPNLFIERQHD
jgi:hypothetical protein